MQFRLVTLFGVVRSHCCLLQVVRNLQPERHGNETHYVWAVVRTLDTPLNTSARNRWPVTWSAEPDDIAFFKNTVKRDKCQEITSNDKTLNMDVLKRLTSVVEWIMSVGTS